MANDIARIHADADAEYTARFRAKQEQIANDANTGRTKFTEGMAEMCAMQQAEILRLQRVLRDNTIVPARLPEAVSISITIGAGNIVRRSLFAKATDGSMWIMTDQQQGGRWERLSALPQAADEADGEQ
jgi:hypothetical protein